MATHDIMPHTSPLGQVNRVVTARMGALTTNRTADTSWRTGEVLIINTAVGDVDVIADGIEDILTTHYIAAAGSEDLIQANNGTSGAATHNITVPMYPLTGPNAGYFITRFAVTSSDTLLTQAQMDAILVGDTVGLWRDNVATGVAGSGENGRFSVNTAGTGLKLVQKLDTLGRDSDQTGSGTTFFVVTTNAA